MIVIINILVCGHACFLQVVLIVSVQSTLALIIAELIML